MLTLKEIRLGHVVVIIYLSIGSPTYTLFIYGGSMYSVLNENIQFVKGIGPKKAEKMARLGIFTVKDALYYFPRQFEDRSRQKKIFQLEEGEKTGVRVKIDRINSVSRRKFSITEFYVSDDTGKAKLVFFNKAYLRNTFRVGDIVKVFGSVKKNLGPVTELHNCEIEYDKLYKNNSYKNLTRIVTLCHEFCHYRQEYEARSGQVSSSAFNYIKCSFSSKLHTTDKFKEYDVNYKYKDSELEAEAYGITDGLDFAGEYFSDKEYDKVKDSLKKRLVRSYSFYNNNMQEENCENISIRRDGEAYAIESIGTMISKKRSMFDEYPQLKKFYDKNGKELPACGQTLLEFESVSKDDLYRIPEDVQIRILADVKSPLCGHQGATYTFGKQKGLDPSLFENIDFAIKEFYEKFSPSILSLKGAGAGGGIAAGLCAFAEASIVSGIDTCLDLIDFDKKVSDADLVIVGEGRLDSQSFAGKAPIGVAKRTPKGVPVIAICGSLSEDLPPLPFENIQAAFSILEKSEPLEDSLKKASLYLEHTAANIGHLLKLRKD